LHTPLDDTSIADLRAGDPVIISGTVYAARDAAHKRLVALVDAGEPLPFDLLGGIIYYVGPTPAPPGRIIGAAGPTTAGRMDVYTRRLLELGLKGMIGKGPRNTAVRAALVRFQAVYFAAVGGAGALLARHIVGSRLIAYPELGPEAVRALEFRDFPAIVANDVVGGDVFEAGRARFKKPG
jgi:fumarate hydratase subunit beta